MAGDATVTVVQFDDQDPHDVIVDARPIAEVRSIPDRFEPRGCTPLYDALGLLLDRAEGHGGDDADQLVVVMTDGLENASRRWDQPSLFRRIGELRDRGWTFVFLGANQDSYEAGGALGMDAGNVSNFRADAAGVAATYDGLEPDGDRVARQGPRRPPPRPRRLLGRPQGSRGRPLTSLPTLRRHDRELVRSLACRAARAPGVVRVRWLDPVGRDRDVIGAVAWRGELHVSDLPVEAAVIVCDQVAHVVVDEDQRVEARLWGRSRPPSAPHRPADRPRRSRGHRYRSLPTHGAHRRSNRQ